MRSLDFSEAACLTKNPDLFYSLDGGGYLPGQVEEAKGVCASCTMRTSCLVDTMENAELYEGAIRGGTTHEERRAVRAGLTALHEVVPWPQEPSSLETTAA